MKLTIILPAFNEEAYLALTLDSIQTAVAHLRARSNVYIQTVVVDNNSKDSTAAIAMEKDATVVHEPVQSVARARNTGARHAKGDIIVFVDADVIVPPTLLDTIYSTMSNPTCLGGAADVYYKPQRLSVKLYLRAWPKVLRSSAVRVFSSRLEATMRKRGSVRTSTSTGISRGLPREQMARSSSYIIHECGRPAVVSTSGLCGKF